MRKLKYIIVGLTMLVILFIIYSLTSIVIFNNRVVESAEPKTHTSFVKNNFSNFVHDVTYTRKDFDAIPFSFYKDSLSNKLLYFQTSSENIDLSNLIQISTKVEQRVPYETYKGGNLLKCMYKIIPDKEKTNKVFVGIENFTKENIVFSTDSVQVVKIPNRFSLALNDKKQTLLIRDFTGVGIREPTQYLVIKYDGETLHFLFFQKEYTSSVNDNDLTDFLGEDTGKISF